MQCVQKCRRAWVVVALLLCAAFPAPARADDQATADAYREQCNIDGAQAWTEKEILRLDLELYPDYATNQWNRRTSLMAYEATLPPESRYPDTDWAEDVRMEIDVYASLKCSAAENFYDLGIPDFTAGQGHASAGFEHYELEEWGAACEDYGQASGYFVSAYWTFVNGCNAMGDSPAYIDDTHPHDDTAFGHLAKARDILDDVELWLMAQ